MELIHAHSVPRLRIESGAIGVVALGLPVALACGYVVLTPSINVLSSLTLYNSKRLLQIGLLAVAALCVAAAPSVRAKWLEQFMMLPRMARWGLGLALGLGLASAATAPVPRRALLSVGHYALLFVLAGAVAVACRRFEATFERAVIAALAVSALLYMATFGVGYALHTVMPKEVALWPGEYSGFDNRRFFNQFQSWTLPLLVLPVLLVSPRRRWTRCGLIGLAACWWMLLFASGGRGTTLGMAVALIGAALLFRRRARPWLKAQFWALGAGLAGYLLLFEMLASSTASLANRDLGGGGRLQDYAEALGHTAAQPWLGLGPMHTAYLPNGLWPTTHNAPLQFIVEWGLPAGLIILALAAWGLWAWACRARHAVLDTVRSNARPQLVHVALTGSLIAAGVHAWVSGVVVMPLSQVMMVLVGGWAWARYVDGTARGDEETSGTSLGYDAHRASAGHWLVAGFALAAAGLTLWGCYPEALHTNAMILEWIFESHQLKLAPRYWHQGIFGF